MWYQASWEIMPTDWLETTSCNLQFFSELIRPTTQLIDFHMVSLQVVFTLLIFLTMQGYKFYQLTCCNFFENVKFEIDDTFDPFSTFRMHINKSEIILTIFLLMAQQNKLSDGNLVILKSCNFQCLTFPLQVRYRNGNSKIKTR